MCSCEVVCVCHLVDRDPPPCGHRKVVQHGAKCSQTLWSFPWKSKFRGRVNSAAFWFFFNPALLLFVVNSPRSYALL